MSNFLGKRDNRVCFEKSWREGLNLRPAVYETAALPTELRQQEIYQSIQNEKSPRKRRTLYYKIENKHNRQEKF